MLCVGELAAEPIEKATLYREIRYVLVVLNAPRFDEPYRRKLRTVRACAGSAPTILWYLTII